MQYPAGLGWSGCWYGRGQLVADACFDSILVTEIIGLADVVRLPTKSGVRPITPQTRL
jgi:hypothetical protein